jgi:hypothetical protein
MPKMLPPASVAFRKRLIDGLVMLDAAAFWYISEDVVAGACPLCGGILSVYFAGMAARAALVCRLGCDEAAVGAALIRPTLRRAA